MQNRMSLPDLDQTLGLRIWRGSKEDGVHGAEDRRVSADPETESHQHNSGKSWIPSEHPESVKKILPEVFNGLPKLHKVEDYQTRLIEYRIGP
jgi:hypothetical protein